MLTSTQLQAAQYAVLDSFTRDEFEDLLGTKLGLRLQFIVPRGASYSEAVFETLQQAERAGWTDDLVRAVYEARRGRVDLAALYQELGLGPPQPEPLVVGGGTPPAVSGGLFYPDLWRDKLAAVERQVCLILSGGVPQGTGFLVGPELVLTCYHMLEPVITQKLGSDAIRCRFDFRTTHDGGVTEGVMVGLASDGWLVDASPYTEGEKRVDPDRETSTPDQLDFALVRLERPIGLDPVGADSRPRGWVRVPIVEPRLKPGDPLAIVQHPKGGPLRMSLNTQAVMGYNANRTRLRYMIDAEPGAAGAPCFDTTWNLVAMHHFVKMGAGGELEYRQGIPIWAIRDRLVRVGKADALGGEVPTAGGEFGSPLPRSGPPPAPGPITHPDDPQKGRWKDQAERDGRRLLVTSLTSHARTFSFDAVVESTDGSTLEGPVVFHLHDTYPQPRIQIRKIREGTRAVLEEVTAYGVFTIGAQVKNARGEWVGLEYDLTDFPNMPKKFLNR